MEYYAFQVYDNDSYLLNVSRVDRHKYATCPVCKMILDKRRLIEDHLPAYKVKRKRYHLSGSYDGFKVVSQALKDLYDISGWQGLVFYPIPQSEGFYLIECSPQIAVNESKRPIEFESKCDECALHMGIYGSVPPYIEVDILRWLNPNTFYRSNLEFGYDFEQGYSLFASSVIVDRLIECKLINRKDIIEVVAVL